MGATGSTVVTKRVYEPATRDDGYRVLVDRLWPRGVSRERAALDLWLKQIAPSTQLRVWFDHQDDRFSDFVLRYTAELENNPALIQLREVIATHSRTTLLYGAKSPTLNEAAVLADYLAASAA